jgi:hypothetical protein
MVTDLQVSPKFTRRAALLKLMVGNALGNESMTALGS